MPTRAFSTSLSPLLIDKASCVVGDGRFPPENLNREQQKRHTNYGIAFEKHRWAAC